MELKHWSFADCCAHFIAILYFLFEKETVDNEYLIFGTLEIINFDQISMRNIFVRTPNKINGLFLVAIGQTVKNRRHRDYI